MLNTHLKQEWKKSGLTLVDIATRCGFTHPYLSNIFSGKQTVSDKTAKKILVKGFKRPPVEAEEMIAQWQIERYKQDLPTPHGWSLDVLDVENIAEVPIYGSISCGPAGDTDAIGYEPIDSTQLDKNKEYYVLQANGESMSPEVPSGSKVLIERTSEYKGASKIYVFKIGADELGLGRLVMNGDKIEIHKSNKEYPPLPANTVEICGVAISITKKL